MRVLVISRQNRPIPREQIGPVMEAFADWRERYRPLLETCDFFVTGAGGCGIVNTSDDVTLSQLLMAFPMAPYSDTEVHILLDADQVLARPQAGGQG